MAEAITPVVHGGKRRPYLAASLLHAVGATLAAGALGLVLAALGAALRGPWDVGTPVAIAAIASLYLAREAFRLPVPLPERKRQVPEWWRTFFSPPVAAFLYGMGLGVGFLTYLTFGTFAVVMAGAFASADPLLGVLVCAPFGFGRAAAVVAATWRGRPSTVDRLHALAESSGPRVANVVALGATGAAAGAALL